MKVVTPLQKMVFYFELRCPTSFPSQKMLVDHVTNTFTTFYSVFYKIFDFFIKIAVFKHILLQKRLLAISASSEPKSTLTQKFFKIAFSC